MWEKVSAWTKEKVSKEKVSKEKVSKGKGVSLGGEGCFDECVSSK
jgi:hypothetical protein